MKVRVVINSTINIVISLRNNSISQKKWAEISEKLQGIFKDTDFECFVEEMFIEEA